jgi:hypothetical protein
MDLFAAVTRKLRADCAQGFRREAERVYSGADRSKNGQRLRELPFGRIGAIMAEDLDTFEEAYAMAKLPPRLTGLPMAVWITPNEGFPHDVRVKVSRIHGGRGRWPDAASVAVRPQPREITPGSLTTADFAAVDRWIDLNQAVIVDYWDGSIDIDEVLQRLARLP